jgi:O-antigen/teichoic acid export membrane protein
MLIKAIIHKTLRKLPYSSIIKDYFRLFSAKVLQMGLAFIREIIIAKIMGPTSYGTWKGIEVIQMYHQYSTLGTQNGMSREIPKLRGMGREGKINNLQNVTLGHIFTLPLLISVLIAFYSNSIHDDLIRFGVRMTTVNVLLLMGKSYYVRLYFADMRFKTYSRITVYLSFILNAAAIGFAVLLQDRAPYIIIFVNNIIWIIALKKYGGYKLVPKISLVESWKLIKIGFPIMIIGLLYGLLTSIDRLIILNYFDVTHLGYYSIFMMVGLVITGVSSSLGEIIYPRMNKLYGEVGTAESLDLLLFAPSYIMSSLLGIVSGVIVFMIVMFGPIYLGEYKQGFTSAIIFCIGSSIGGGSILNTIDKQWLSVIFQSIALVINVLLSLLLIQLNYGIVAVAIGTTVALVFYKLCGTCASYYYANISIYDQLKRLGVIIIPSILTGLYFLLSQYFVFVNGYSISIQVLIFLLFLIVSSIMLALRAKSVFNQSIYTRYGIKR